MRELQRELHRSADAKRYLNRLENPFIAEKETRLAKIISTNFPEGGKTFLEVGCGEGSNLHYLKNVLPNADFTGIDFSPGKIHFLASKGLNIKSVCGDATSLPFKDAIFNLVLCRDLLHHADYARERVITEAVRVTEHGGLIVIIESDGRSFLNRLFRLVYPSERGMRSSVPSRLRDLAAPFGDVELSYVEASFLLRAIAFFLGWPRRGILRSIAELCYTAARLWEMVVEATIPKSKWTYMMITIAKK